jgi:hypothetical protein
MAARAVNITDKGKRNPQPWTLPKAERSYYVHGLHGAKTATLAGAYGTKPEAMKAARRLANEEGEDVSISAPKGAMIVVHPNPAIRKNLFGFGKGKDARRTTPAHGGIAYHQAKVKSRKSADDKNAEYLKTLAPAAQKHAKSTTFKGRAIKPTEGGSWVVPSIDKESEFDTLQDAKAFITSWKRNPAKRNPAGPSAKVFEEFHGYGPTEVIKVSKERHHHEWVASAGDLVGLQVKPISGGEKRKIEGLGECFLAFNEAKNQLFIEGGDQRMSPAELKKFGIKTEHELHTLGKLVGVGYFTEKTHLGDEGGEAVYTHTFRATNVNGKHVIVKIARYPDLIYRVMDEQFEVSGGSYEILREGINK